MVESRNGLVFNEGGSKRLAASVGGGTIRSPRKASSAYVSPPHHDLVFIVGHQVQA